MKIDSKDIHHLIYKRIVDREPIACSPSFEGAVAFAGETERELVFVLHITVGDSLKPCPICSRAHSVERIERLAS